MSKENNADNLIIPIYINEKIVLDMLAILEDGFAMVSQVNSIESSEKSSNQKGELAVGTDSLLSKLLKINISGELNHSGTTAGKESVTKEKVHTSASLFSKFRKYLVDNKALLSEDDFEKIGVGDFIEVGGSLTKNPIIDYLDSAIDLFRLVEVLKVNPVLGEKNKANEEKAKTDKLVKQIKEFNEELKHSGTIDFILSKDEYTVVLSVLEQYLTNDITEIIGGHFKVLGKVISVCNTETDKIDLLRKTSLSCLPDNALDSMRKAFMNDKLKDFKLPDLRTSIDSPAVIIIPIAIYA